MILLTFKRKVLSYLNKYMYIKSQTLKTYSWLCSVLFLITVFVLTGCKKSNSLKEKTKTELLTASQWKFSQVGIDQNSDGTIDYPLPTTLLPVCEADNLFTFKADSTGVLDEGKELCTTTAKQTTPFTWKFLNNDTEISTSVAILPLSEGAAKVIELNETTFTLSKNITVFGFPIPLTIIAVMVH